MAVPLEASGDQLSVRYHLGHSRFRSRPLTALFTIMGASALVFAVRFVHEAFCAHFSGVCSAYGRCRSCGGARRGQPRSFAIILAASRATIVGSRVATDFATKHRNRPRELFSQQFSEEASQPFLEPQAGATLPTNPRSCTSATLSSTPWTQTANWKRAFPRSRHRPHANRPQTRAKSRSSKPAGWSISCPTLW